MILSEAEVQNGHPSAQPEPSRRAEPQSGPVENLLVYASNSAIIDTCINREVPSRLIREGP